MKTIYTDTNKILLEWLTSKRMLEGVTQQQLSDVLAKPQSFVSKYENGERRLDLVETIDICNALNADPHELIDTLKKGIK
ncbi:MAG: transcriptional regulator with XRE-family HTH domain [Candidatus Latescibacterota bacterium]|jgi:transcriptional regulator with XRE-family HTH domain